MVTWINKVYLYCSHLSRLVEHRLEYRAADNVWKYELRTTIMCLDQISLTVTLVRGIVYLARTAETKTYVRCITLFKRTMHKLNSLRETRSRHSLTHKETTLAYRTSQE